MFGSLRKKLEEAVAQVNPFDSGKTAATVRASRNQPVAPVQTRRSGLSVGVARPNQTVSVAPPMRRANLDVLKPQVQTPLKVGVAPSQNLRVGDQVIKNTTRVTSLEPKQFGNKGIVRNTINYGAEALKDTFTKPQVWDMAPKANLGSWKGSGLAESFVNSPFRMGKGGVQVGQGQIKEGAGNVVAGAIESPLGLLPVGKAFQAGSKGAGLGAKVLAGAMTGGREGLVYGAGYGAGDAMSRNENTNNIVKNAALSGALGGAGGAVLGGGMPAITSGLAKGANSLKVPTSNLVKNMRSNLTPLNEGGFIEVGRTPKRIHPEDQNIMSDFIDMQRGIYKPDPQTGYQLELDASRIAERYGLPMPNSAQKLANVFDKRLQQEGFGGMEPTTNLVKKTASKLTAPFKDEGGFVRIPGGKNDPAPDLKMPRKDLINQYAEMLQSIDDGNSGVSIMPDGTRASQNSKFYSDTYAKQGRPPTKAQWFDEARRQLESGKGDSAFQEEFNRLTPDTEDLLTRGEGYFAPDTRRGEVFDVSNGAGTATKTKVAPPRLPKTYTRPVRQPSPEALVSGANPMLPKRRDLTGKRLSIPNSQLAPEVPDFNAVAGARGSKNAKRLEQAIANSDEITEAARRASLEGQELNYFAKKDANGRSVGVEPFNPEYHRIEAGFVLDKQGRVLGNHIKVDETGVQVNVGGDLVNMNSVIGDADKWKNTYRVSETMDRNLQRAAPDAQTYRRTRRYVIDHKTKQEAIFRQELQVQRKALQDQAKTVMKAKPLTTGKKEYKADLADYIEGKLTNVDIRSKYGADAEKVITAYKAQTRTLYNDLLDRVNAVFTKFGEPPVPKRTDYLTHISELNKKPNFAGELYGSLQNSVLGDGQQKTRGGVPGEIAGRTENFEPRKKWNPFFQRRTGDDNYVRDPFLAVDTYLEPTLYNIHMTESAVRARSVEAAFRTADKLKADFTELKVKESLKEAFDTKGETKNDLVTGLQEYANALAGKTQRWDRQVIDSGKGSRAALQGWQRLQRIGGRATILGNAQSVVAQTLGLPTTIASAGHRNTIMAIKDLALDSKAIKQSNFVNARKTQVQGAFRTKAEKTLDGLGVPLRKVEEQFIQLTWHAQHRAAKAKGFKGKEAIMEADRLTERLVAGRGIADRPELYRSTLANGILQYTLEVNAQNKVFWKDLSTTQKAKFVTAAFGMNAIMQQVTGFEPLPDFLGASLDTIEDFADPEDKRTSGEKALQGGQRMLGEYADMNPLLTAGANLLPQSTRKTIFGDESNLGRFDGQTAPVKVVTNTIDSVKKLSEGNISGARDKALQALVPAGNQIRKTWSAAEALNRGYAVDGQGNPTYATPTDPVGITKSLVFGTGSTKQAREYYDNDGRAITNTKAQTVKNSANPGATVSQIQQERKTGTSSEQRNEIFKAAFSSPEGQEYLALDSTQRKNHPLHQHYLNMERAFTDASTANVSPQANKFLTTHSRLSDDARNKKINSENDYEYKLALAEYERDMSENKLSKVDQMKKQNELLDKQVGSNFSRDTREIYSMSKENIYKFIENNPITEDQWQQLLALDQAEIKAGLRKYSKFGGRSGGRGRKGGRGGKKKGKYDYTKNLFASTSTSNSVSKSLREILESAMKG